MGPVPRKSPIKQAALLSLAVAPLLVLGATLSKMETVERYYMQLSVVVSIELLCVVAAIGALRRHGWAVWLLTALYGLAATFWLYSALELAQVPEPGLAVLGIAAFPAAIGLLCAHYACALFVHARAGIVGRAPVTRG
jgi:hypothetical protein